MRKKAKDRLLTRGSETRSRVGNSFPGRDRQGAGLTKPLSATYWNSREPHG